MIFLTTGFASYDFATFILRLLPGVFFLCYRFRWVYDPAKAHPWFCQFRRAKLIERMCTCGFGANPYLAGTVALGEVFGGAALIVGFLTIPAAVGILVIMVFATCCEPPEEIRKMAPVDKADYVAKFLLFCEPLYLAIMLVLIAVGPGKWSLDYYLFGG